MQLAQAAEEKAQVEELLVLQKKVRLSPPPSLSLSLSLSLSIYTNTLHSESKLKFSDNSFNDTST